MLRARVLAAALGVLVVLVTGGCAGEATQDTPSTEPQVNTPAEEPEAEVEAPPSDAEYNALRVRLTDAIPGIQDALRKAVDESDFTPMYDEATAFLEIGHGIVGKIEDTPELDPQGTDLALVIATYDAIDATIGELQDNAAEARLIYLDNYPDGENRAEYERWLILNGYR